jgi:hypothetical protein
MTFHDRNLCQACHRCWMESIDYASCLRDLAGDT